VKYVTSLFVLFAVLLSSCNVYRAMNEGPITTPKTGPGTPWHCNPASSTYCGDHTCCPQSEPVCVPNACEQTPYAGNNDWIGAQKKSVPRQQAVQ